MSEQQGHARAVPDFGALYENLRMTLSLLLGALTFPIATFFSGRR